MKLGTVGGPVMLVGHAEELSWVLRTMGPLWIVLTQPF